MKHMRRFLLLGCLTIALGGLAFTFATDPFQGSQAYAEEEDDEGWRDWPEGELADTWLWIDPLPKVYAALPGDLIPYEWAVLDVPSGCDIDRYIEIYYWDPMPYPAPVPPTNPPHTPRLTYRWQFPQTGRHAYSLPWPCSPMLLIDPFATSGTLVELRITITCRSHKSTKSYSSYVRVM